jgi:hypothetical protein
LDYWSIDCSHVAVLVGLVRIFDSAPQKASLAGFHQGWAATSEINAANSSVPGTHRPAFT